MSSYAEIEGIAFEPLSSRSQPATLIYDGFEFSIKSNGEIIADGLVMETIQGKSDFYFTDGRYFQAHYGLTRDLLREFKGVAEPTVSRVEVIVPKSVVSILVVLTILAGGVVYALANLGASVGSVFPDELERQIGIASHQSMVGFVLKPSNIPPERQADLRRRTQEMIAVGGLERKPELMFHSSSRLGANALAFPGGPIVVTDDLVKLLNDDMVMAVIAHELGHVEERHSLKEIINRFGVSIFIIIFLGSDASIVDELATFGVNFWGFKNSRDHEHDADLFAVELLRLNALNPALYGQALTLIQNDACSRENLTGADCAERADTNWFSTHPGLSDRLEHINH